MNSTAPPPSPPSIPPTSLLATGRRFARVVPLAFVTYSLAFLDRVNYGTGESGGLQADLKISATTSAWVASMFFIGYALFQIPGAAYAAHRSVRKLIFWTLLFWGLFSSLTGLVSSIPLLMAVRGLLGVAEGVVYPAMLIYINHWFSRREKSRANSFLVLGNALTVTWAMALSGYLVEFFNAHHAFGLKGWQMMFVLEGLPSIVWAFFWLALASDRPRDARWLTAEQAEAIQAVLDAEQRDIPPVKNYRAAFADRRVLLICVQFFFWSVPQYGFTIWLPRIVKEGFGQGMGVTGLLAAIPYFCAILATLTVSYFSDRAQRRKAFIWPALVAAALGSLAAALASRAGPAYFGLCFVAVTVSITCIFASYGPFWSMLPEMIPRNVAGESIALINSAGAVGGFAGTFFMRWVSDAYGAPTAFGLMALCLAAAAALILPVAPRRPITPSSREPGSGPYGR